MQKMIMKFWLAGVLLLAWQVQVRGQHLDVPVVYQERSQWCWAAVSKSVLGYYGHAHEQCEIAEYTRSVATWHSFGPVHCCTGGCDHWNYLQGTAGSIEDILLHFGSLQTSWTSGILLPDEILAEMAGGRPFVIRWGWTAGGGHFLVIHGLSGNNVYYMDPLYGSMVAGMTQMYSGPHHTWTSTLRLGMHTSVIGFPGTGVPGSRPGEDQQGHSNAGFIAYPNPATGQVRLVLNGICGGSCDGAQCEIHAGLRNESVQLSLVDTYGKVVRVHYVSGGLADGFTLDTGDLVPGLYVLVVDGPQTRMQQRLLVAGNSPKG